MYQCYSRTEHTIGAIFFYRFFHSLNVLRCDDSLLLKQSSRRIYGTLPVPACSIRGNVLQFQNKCTLWLCGMFGNPVIFMFPFLFSQIQKYFLQRKNIVVFQHGRYLDPRYSLQIQRNCWDYQIKIIQIHGLLQLMPGCDCDDPDIEIIFQLFR